MRPPQTIISEPVQTAVCPKRGSGCASTERLSHIPSADRAKRSAAPRCAARSSRHGGLCPRISPAEGPARTASSAVTPTVRSSREGATSSHQSSQVRFGRCRSRRGFLRFDPRSRPGSGKPRAPPDLRGLAHPGRQRRSTELKLPPIEFDSPAACGGTARIVRELAPTRVRTGWTDEELDFAAGGMIGGGIEEPCRESLAHRPGLPPGRGVNRRSKRRRSRPGGAQEQRGEALLHQCRVVSQRGVQLHQTFRHAAAPGLPLHFPSKHQAGDGCFPEHVERGGLLEVRPHLLLQASQGTAVSKGLDVPS